MTKIIRGHQGDWGCQKSRGLPGLSVVVRMTGIFRGHMGD